MMSDGLRLAFQGGTVRLDGLAQDDATSLPPACAWDARENTFRLPASSYADIVLWLRAKKLAFTDEARTYDTLDVEPAARHEPFPYQREALDAWAAHRFRGVVVLPTGAGKTYVATMAIAGRKRSTLVVVPTLDLLNQWYDILAAAFGRAIGVIGGGYHEVEPITVTTYDSAHLHMDRLGGRFGLVVFDECHHLPSPSYQLAARMSIAPFRLGLTATPERTDGRAYDELIGPIVYRKDITELSGEYLASYETERISVPLSPEEREAYDTARGEYVTFLREEGIRMSAPDGWSRFLYLSSRSDAGRRAFLAYRRQRALALAAPGKINVLARLLHNHRHDRTIVFTEDNATVHQISRRFLLPAITHQTRVKERSAILAAFNAGDLTAVVTSKVLNEGVNVPEANVAIVLSGNGSVREHVQRLGRILRKGTDKRALLYELVAENTAEQYTSDKRREHVAYK
ncbi:DEAD/DEAH box helicase family protein [Polyangium sorediatum]|uniref:DNA 3'-5' helicase n=2 Tax=Polyangium sorediatum TaxID=889274 RepID=A0ABT6NSY5_9BACT|nr:DEAD/DEAH box helicase family protein [Polyangium sorediatum]MDI1431255.1 DEAD/DEAH box helicase family protein [Polyangium sorediatum]